MKIHEYNEMMAYLTRPAVDRTGFVSGDIVIGKKNTEVENLFGVRAVRSPADNIPGATKFTDEWVYFKNKEDAKNFKKLPRKITMKPGAIPSDDPERLKSLFFVRRSSTSP